jgi:hypothetical protein
VIFHALDIRIFLEAINGPAFPLQDFLFKNIALVPVVNFPLLFIHSSLILNLGVSWVGFLPIKNHVHGPKLGWLLTTLHHDLVKNSELFFCSFTHEIYQGITFFVIEKKFYLIKILTPYVLVISSRREAMLTFGLR